MTVNMDTRERWCDGWPMGGRGHRCDQSREYRLLVRQWEPRTTVLSEHGTAVTLPEGERDMDEEYWMCDRCAAQMCATHILDRQTTREIHVYPNNGRPYTEQRPFGVWKLMEA